MRETPAQFVATCPAGRPSSENLARFRYHTGGEVRPLAPDEPCPVLFRDIGPEAMARFLRGDLRRLCGPSAPLTYFRSAAYQEPYCDYGQIGRLVALRPLVLSPWFSGVPHIYVTPASRFVDPPTIGFLPPHVSFAAAERLLTDVSCVSELREALGGREFDAALSDTRMRLDELNAAHADSEAFAAPLRECYQAADQRQRETARELMQPWGLTEEDLCTAWHHLPLARRELLQAALPAIAQRLEQAALPRAGGVFPTRRAGAPPMRIETRMT